MAKAKTPGLGRNPWIKWYTRDWRSDPPLRMCSFAARGLWADLLSLMAEANVMGFLLVEGVAPTPRDLVGLLGGAERDIKRLVDELGAKNVYSVTGRPMPDDVRALIPDDMPDGVIFSRRMLRDKARAEINKINGADGGNPDIPRGLVPKSERIRGYKRSDSPQKTQRIFDMHEGRCHWCGVALLFQPDGGPTGYHVDHVLAVCDGGTNDEANLVPACASCNHARVRLDMVGRLRQQPFFASDPNRSDDADHKAQNQKPDFESSSSSTESDPAREAQRAEGARLARSPGQAAMDDMMRNLANKKRVTP